MTDDTVNLREALEAARRIVRGFLECPEIADCAPEDKDPETDELERKARALLASAKELGEGDSSGSLSPRDERSDEHSTLAALEARVLYGDARLANPRGHDPVALAALNLIRSQRMAKDEAYEERNRVVAALASLFPSGVAQTNIPGWLPEWHGCVYIDLPTGQASWHYHDSQAHLFDALPAYTKPWDGHTTPEKYERLAELAREPDTRGEAHPSSKPASQGRDEVVEMCAKIIEDGLHDGPIILSGCYQVMKRTKEAQVKAIRALKHDVPDGQGKAG